MQQNIFKIGIYLLVTVIMTTSIVVTVMFVLLQDEREAYSQELASCLNEKQEEFSINENNGTLQEEENQVKIIEDFVSDIDIAMVKEDLNENDHPIAFAVQELTGEEREKQNQDAVKMTEEEITISRNVLPQVYYRGVLYPSDDIVQFTEYEKVIIYHHVVVPLTKHLDELGYEVLSMHIGFTRKDSITPIDLVIMHQNSKKIVNYGAAMQSVGYESYEFIVDTPPGYLG